MEALLVFNAAVAVAGQARPYHHAKNRGFDLNEFFYFVLH